MALFIGITLVLLACSTTPAAARYDCDPFEGGTPQSSHKCPCSDQVDSRYYCASAVQYTVFEITEKVRALFLSIQETGARVEWLAARFIANLAEALLRGQIWQSIREGVLEQLQSVMGGPGGTLARVTGGGNGLFLIALLLAGLAMAFPLLGASQLVQPDRVILWGVVLFALFIGGAQGFDLTNAIENLRVQLIETIAEGDEGDGLIDLVARPVDATPLEARQLDTGDLATLPGAMIQDHFIGLPQGSRCQGEGGGADECQKYRVIAFETNLAGQDLEYMFTAVKYKPDVISGRQKQYTSGLVRMTVTLLAALVLLLFGIVFALLSAASLVLITFFVAMLPLGFFEFGSAVLSGLMRQYTSVVGLSLFAAVMVRLMGGITGTIFGTVSDFSDVLGLLTYLGMLLIIGLGLQMAVRSAWGLVDGAFTILRASVQTVGMLAFAAGGGPLGRTTHATSMALKAASSSAVNSAMAAGAGLAAGGLGTAFLAGAGGLLSGSKAGHQIADVAEAAEPSGLGAQVFTTAVRSPGGWQTAIGVAAVGDQAREASLGNFLAGIRHESAPLHPKWGAVDRGSYLTTDLNLLKIAEQSYFERRDGPQARRALERAFGSRAVADEALGAYEIRGRAGAERVRRVVEITQASAEDWMQRGRDIWDAHRHISPACESQIIENLRLARLYDERRPHQSAWVGRLAGAALRRPVEVWQDPQAPRKLAWDTFDPEHSEVQVDDLPAQYRLREAVQRMGWDQDRLAHAFACLPQAAQRAARQGRPVVDGLLDEWRGDDRFAAEGELDLREAARLAVLVGASAQLQQSQPMPARRGDLLPPVAGFSRQPGRLAVAAPYSADLAQQLQASFSAADCHWDEAGAAWQIAPQHEATVRRILEEVAEENGWRVQEIGPDDILDSSSHGVQVEGISPSTADPLEGPGAAEPEANPAALWSVDVGQTNGSEIDSFPEDEWQGDSPELDMPCEPAWSDAPDGLEDRSSPQAEEGQALTQSVGPATAAMLEPQAADAPATLKVPSATHSAQSRRGSSDATGRAAKTTHRQADENAEQAPLPDEAQPAPVPETP